MTDETPRETDEYSAFYERVRAFGKKNPAYMAFLESLIYELERMDPDDRTIQRTLTLFDFCYEHPDLALLFATYSRSVHMHSDAPDAEDLQDEVSI